MCGESYKHICEIFQNVKLKMTLKSGGRLWNQGHTHEIRGT